MEKSIPEFSKKTHTWASRRFLPGIIILGLLLRFFRVNSRGIWYDDAFSMVLSNRSITEIISGTAADTMPPLYYFLLHYWMKISTTIWFTRTLNILISVLIIWMGYQWIKEIKGQKPALIFAFLIAISPFQIYHAQEIRMYSLFCLGLLGYVWMFTRLFILNHKKKANWVWMVFFGVVALYTHNLAIFTLLSVNVYLLFRQEWNNLLKTIAAQIIIGLVFSPWLVLVPGQIEKIQSAFWTPQPGLIELIQAVNTLLGSMPQPQVVLVIMTILCLQIFALLIYLACKQWKKPEMQLFLVLVLFPGTLLFIISYIMRPVYVPRAMIFSGICMYALAAVLTGEDRLQESGKPESTNAKYFVVAMIFLVSLLTLPYQYSFDQFPRSPYKQLAVYLEVECVQQKCLILHDNKLSYFPTYIYDSTIPATFIADMKGSHNDSLALTTQQAIGILAAPDALTAADNSPELWFVTQSKAIDEAKEMGMADVPNLAQIKKKYQVTEENHIGDLVVYRLLK